MQRRAMKLIVFLLAIGGGAIINVAVAWTLLSYAYRFAPGDSGKVILYPTTVAQPTPWHKQMPAPPNAAYGSAAVGRFGWQTINAWVNDERNVSLGESYIESVGWPLLTVQRFLPLAEATRRFHFEQVAGRWPTWSDLAAHRVVLPGFAINTIFYAAMVWMVFAVPSLIRRRVRKRRGQCAACGYSLRGSSGVTCPECGARVVANASAS